MSVRRTILFALFLVAPVLAAAKPAPPREPFAFRDWHARDAYLPDDPRILTCTPIPAGTACILVDDRIAGVQARQVGAAFGRNGLFALEAKFPSEHADVVEAALRDRYGRPCEERVEHPMNALMMRFDNRIRVWCFADGRATFKSIHNNVDESSFEFATRDAARQAAVRDF